MLDIVKSVLDEVSSYNPKNLEELEQFRIQYLGKKGKMTDLFAALKSSKRPKKRFRSSFKSA